MHPAHARRTLTGAVTLAALSAEAQPGPRLPFAVPTIPLARAIQPKANGALRQSPNLRGMTCSIAGQISHLPIAFKPQPGDLIHSSAPENVGPVVPGEVMKGRIHGLPSIRVRVVAA